MDNEEMVRQAWETIAELRRLGLPEHADGMEVILNLFMEDLALRKEIEDVAGHFPNAGTSSENR